MKTLLPLLFATTLVAADNGNWPQWRGPARTDISAETGLLRQWPEGGGGPKQLWVSRDAGIGYSGPAIVDGVLYTMGALPLTASGLEEQGGEEAVAEAHEPRLPLRAVGEFCSLYGGQHHPAHAPRPGFATAA